MAILQKCTPDSKGPLAGFHVNLIGCTVLLLMAEILHQLIGSLSHYF